MEYAGTGVPLTSGDIFFRKEGDRRRTTRKIAFVVLLAAFAAVFGCRKSSPPEAVESFNLAWSGCTAVSRETSDGGAGTVCEIGPTAKLRLVLPPNATDASVRTNDGVLDGGANLRALTVDVTPAGGRIVVDAKIGGRPARTILALAPARKHPWLEEAKAHRAKGDLARAAEMATVHTEDSDPIDRGLAKGLLARITLARGRADEAFPLFREAIEMHREHGRISDAVDDSFALAFALHQRSQRYAEARAALDATSPLLALYPEGNAREPYYRGIVAAETGDRRTALVLLREAERRARDLGMVRLERNARSALALEMQELGRARASLEVLRALERELDDAAAAPKSESTPTPCERVELANNIGWGALLANEAANARVEDARAPLVRAIAIDGCADAYVRSAAVSNLARLAVDEGDLEAATRYLEAAKTAVKEPRGIERIGWIDLEARILLASGKPSDALKRFDDALALSRAAVLALPEWSALVGRADALLALKREGDAVVSLHAAEEILDTAALLVPLGEGRAAFVADRSKSAIALVDLLVKRRAWAEGMAAARRSRARVLGGASRALRIERLGPEERARWEEAVRAYRTARAAIDAEAAKDWSLPSDHLARISAVRKDREQALRSALEAALALLEPPKSEEDGGAASPKPSPSALDLDIHPTKTGAVAFVTDASGTRAHAIGPAPSESMAAAGAALFEPAKDALLRARLVRVRAYGAWRKLDVHALPFEGTALLAHVPVVYPLGIGGASPKKTTAALVVGDPTGDLPNARIEAESVAKKLGAKLLLQNEATSEALAAALRTTGHFHYAGHGVFGGTEGWESALPLANGGRLGVGDILALAPAPRTVVLAGCEAARSDGDAEGLGLAQAFVAAGSSQVLAPVRPVPDGLSAKLAARLYSTPTEDLPGAARRAILELREEDHDADWSAFRVLSP